LVAMLPPCPRCGAASVHALDATDRNRMVSEERFQYCRCTACGVLWLPEIPEDLARYYPADYHDFLRGNALAAAVAAEAPRVALLARHVEPGHIVEIGPSQGVFAAAVSAAGYDVVGLEMDPACCRHLEEVVGVRAINTDAPAAVLPELQPSRAAVMWHVLEHLPNPWELLRAVAANLERGGVLALATPNPQSLQMRVFGSRWVHLDAPRHVTLVPLSALEEELAGLGLRLAESTTVDPVGITLNLMGWRYSILSPPALRPDPRLGYAIGDTLNRLARPVERRDLRGAAYTAVFVKNG
jgi:2-polyprenyl-3-methyl-5-hydroxy-6-metoxy-1,4-benzoquinol methylase